MAHLEYYCKFQIIFGKLVKVCLVECMVCTTLVDGINPASVGGPIVLMQVGAKTLR